MRGGRQPLRDHPLLLWLVAAAVVALVHRWVPEATWLMIHLVLLGAMSHAVMVWSAHFARTLLRAPEDPVARRAESVRLLLLLLGAAAVLVGVPTTWWPLTVVGAAVVAMAVVWHGIALWRALRRALPGRFRVTVHYYVAASAALPVGAVFGVLLARGLSETWHGRLLVAHSLTMLLGWLGLTVTGTLITFWPTVLRTRMDDRTETLARQALPVLVGAIAVVITGAVAALVPVTLLGLLGYVVGLGWVGRGLLGPLRRRPPREFAGFSIMVAALWFLAAITATGVAVATLSDAELAELYPTLAAMWAVGFALQLVTGALSHLLPAMIGGGPVVVRASSARFNIAAATRLVVINGGLLIFLLPGVSGWVRVTTSSLVLVALVSFLPIMIVGIRTAVRTKRRLAEDRARPDSRTTAKEPADRQPGAPGSVPVLTANGWIAGVVALTVVAAIGAGLEPGTTPQVVEAEPSGRTVAVTVEAHDMRFVPDRVAVGRGDRLVITLVNRDPTNVHDLQIGDSTSERVGPGEQTELVIDSIGASIEGWCTVVGHRAMGMTFAVLVDDQPVDAGGNERGGDGQGVGHQPHRVGTEPLQSIIDPVLDPAPEGRAHRVELRLTEVPLEVAPGVWQRRWTFGGHGVGPTLRGKVGDTFEVTLVNDGTMGHSIDFHASALAPDGPMRTIAPGESLVYAFTARRAGIWLYHCGTAPMSAHIAAGLHGAVIIDPPDLPPVDHEYLLVQSEVHLSADGATSPADARDVDVPAAMRALEPDFVVFNGIAGQYQQRPLTARVGERVRVWVLDAGPNRATSFHVVGGQFDTVFAEGAYLLRRGADAFGTTSGGAQVLALQPAQGGFVELTFPEPGHYPAITHVMADAERGAAGVFEVSPAP
ncbi:multicopper oxidase domain-containing protein [Microlunatus sp. Y2014]|uniref:multicopper oxidase domain-containing protein n=1 Tax=Microlunatus sp. Y2014 TaxID=3418488 RepID=UPI003DA7904C